MRWQRHLGQLALHHVRKTVKTARSASKDSECKGVQRTDCLAFSIRITSGALRPTPCEKSTERSDSAMHCSINGMFPVDPIKFATRNGMMSCC